MSKFDNAIKMVLSNPGEFLPALVREGRQQLEKLRQAPMDKESLAQGNALSHIGVHYYHKNAGDELLLWQVRELIESQYGVKPWNLIQIGRPEGVPEEKLKYFQNNSAAFILGGGGYIFPGGATTCKKSGWHSPFDLSFLDNLDIPLITFAVGYNSIGDDKNFPSEFIDNINKYVDKSAFFSLRNRGSISSLKEYLDPSLHHKLELQPCPTTIMRKFSKDFVGYERSEQIKTVAISAGVDHPKKRFTGEGQLESILTNIAKAAKVLDLDGYEIIFVTHTSTDFMLYPYLVREGVKFKIKRLERVAKREIINFYKGVSLSLSMRGHGQMIPFGCGNAIISLSLHNKLRYLLNDLGHPDWGVELSQNNFVDEIVDKVRLASTDISKRHKEIDSAQDRLWNITKENFSCEKLGKFLNS